MYSKVIQRSITQKYPNTDYTTLEGYSRYFSSHLLGSNEGNSRGHTYNSAFADLTGDDISRAYDAYQQGSITQQQLDQVIQNTTNNNLALSESLQQSGITPEEADNDLADLNNHSTQ